MFLSIVTVIAIVIVYQWYAGLISKKNTALEALASVDVQLTKRHDLIPNILKVASSFMQHETQLFTDITDLRTKSMAQYNKNNPDEVTQRIETEKALQNKLSNLMMVAENYPNLKSNETMVQTQQTLNEVEEQISAARRFYNTEVTALNNAVEIFPGSLIAKVCHINTMPYFHSEEDTKPIDTSEYLKP